MATLVRVSMTWLAAHILLREAKALIEGEAGEAGHRSEEK